jgi:hypothetical protein
MPFNTGVTAANHGARTCGLFARTARVVVGDALGGEELREERRLRAVEEARRDVARADGRHVDVAVSLQLELERERLREADHGPFARRVGRAEREPDEPGRARDVHDVAVAAGDQVGQERVRHRDQAERVHAIGRQVLLERDVEEAAAEDQPRVVHEDVDRADVARDLLLQARDARHVGHVEHVGVDARSRLREGGGGVAERRLVEIDEHDLGAIGGEPIGDRLPDSRGAAGDEGPLSFERLHGASLLRNSARRPGRGAAASDPAMAAS